jgi:hypothetical protein
MKIKNGEKIFLEVMLNGAVVAKKQLNMSERVFLSVMLSKKRGKK